VWDDRPQRYDTYERASHIFNARHWVNSVTAARHYGAMIGERFIELRYEDLVGTPEVTARQLLRSLDMRIDDRVIAHFVGSVRVSAVGKHRAIPPRQLAQVLKILQPTFEANGYNDVTAHARDAGLFRRLWRR